MFRLILVIVLFAVILTWAFDYFTDGPHDNYYD